MSLPKRLVDFVGALREHGVTAGTSETVDAAAVITALGLQRRDQLREGLAAALLRRTGQRGVFDSIFDLYFPAAVGDQTAAAALEAIEPPTAGRLPDPAQLAAVRDALVELLAAQDEAGLAAMVAALVNGLGRYGTQTPGQAAGQGGWSAYQTLQRVQPTTLTARIAERIPDDAVPPGPFADRMRHAEATRRINQFRAQVRAEARRRTAELRDTRQMSRQALDAVTEQLDILSVSGEQLAELRRTVRPLARTLATRLSVRRRRSLRGEIDLRRTLRGSLSTGGVPMHPVLRTRRRGKPELVLLCDLSGSVARFADFTLLLVQALADQFSRTRAFAFIETVDEITDLVADARSDPNDLIGRVSRQANLVRWSGRSNYGHSLGAFAREYSAVVGPRSSVLILGDGRTNGGDPNLDAVHAIAARARHIYWLNPEPRRSWSTGDSEAGRYGSVVPMFECRTAHQLADVIGRLLPV